jgi:hypothetical protein
MNMPPAIVLCGDLSFGIDPTHRLSGGHLPSGFGCAGRSGFVLKMR